MFVKLMQFRVGVCVWGVRGGGGTFTWDHYLPTLCIVSVGPIMIYRLWQKKIIQFGIKYLKYYLPIHGVNIVRCFSCKLTFVSFKFDIHKLRYCH